MYYNPDVYNVENLKESDKNEIEIIEDLKQTVLTESVIEDFIEENCVSGETIRKLYKDVLKDFADFVSERIEYFKVDFIIWKIDNYSDEEVENFCKSQEKI